MVGGDRTFLVRGISLAFVVALLAGCGADTGEGAELSLGQTKSPVQLLRNDAAGRIPPAVIEIVEDAQDLSVACLDEADDPMGLRRSWHSTAIVTIEDGATWRIEAVVTDLVGSYVDQGWVARPLGGSPTVKNTLLTSDASFAEIRVASKVPDVDAVSTSTDEVVEAAVIEVQVHGPCVTTAGAESEEVASLEGR